jgi:hypothetical protein
MSRILETTHPDIFKEKIFPSLIPLLNVKEPYQILLILLQEIEYITSRIEENAIKNRTCSSCLKGYIYTHAKHIKHTHILNTLNTLNTHTRSIH